MIDHSFPSWGGQGCLVVALKVLCPRRPLHPRQNGMAGHLVAPAFQDVNGNILTTNCPFPMWIRASWVMLSAMLSNSMLTISSSGSGKEFKNWTFAHISSPVILYHHEKHACEHVICFNESLHSKHKNIYWKTFVLFRSNVGFFSLDFYFYTFLWHFPLQGTGGKQDQLFRWCHSKYTL